MSSFIIQTLLNLGFYIGQKLQYILALSGLTSLFIISCLVFRFNWKRCVSEVGYTAFKFKNKSIEIQQVMKNRKIGKLPPVYPNGWFMLLESENLLPGKVKYVTALGENFAVFRSYSRISYIIDAYCPHIGANMAIGGKVKGDCLQCPFHHWVFSGKNGKCVSIPYAKKVPAFASVKHWECFETNGFIFVWYHAENEKPSWYPPSVPEINDGSYKFYGRNEFLVNCHIQEIPENGGDLNHFSTIHTSSVLHGSTLSSLEKGNMPLLNILKHSWQAEWKPSSYEEEKHIGVGKLFHEMLLFQKIQLSPVHVVIRQIGPALVELIIKTPYGPLILLQCVTPQEALLQRVVHRIYCPPPCIFHAYFTIFVESIMIERDVIIWNHKKYINTPVIVSEEQTLARHRRWFNQFYSKNSPSYSENKNNFYW